MSMVDGHNWSGCAACACLKVRSGDAKGAASCPNVLASSLAGGKAGEDSSSPHIPGGSPMPWVSPRIIIHGPEPSYPPRTVQ
jgi:hypothetical protein